MSAVDAIWSMFFMWMPVPLQIVFFVFLTVAVIVMVIRLIGTIMQALPFV